MNPKMLGESKVAVWLIGLYGKSRSIIGDLIKNSGIAGLFSRIKQGFFNKAVKSASIFLFTAVLVNILLSVILHKEIDLLDIIIKGVILFLSLCGFFCSANWKDVKKSSIILSKIFK